MAPAAAPLPAVYRLFFLYVEPVATAVGAYYAALRQADYMQLTAGGGPVVSARESIVLDQLANMYWVFALNEALVLRAAAPVTTPDRLRVWRVFLLGLLVADFGHLASVRSLGLDVYYRVWDWNAMAWGNLGFVYVGAALRIAFLLGLGLPAALSAPKVTS